MGQFCCEINVKFSNFVVQIFSFVFKEMQFEHMYVPKIPKFSFPLSPKGQPIDESNLGPGSYEYGLSTNRGKSAVIVPRRPETAKNTKIPGPGSYNVKNDPFSVPK